jgi:hypothetical protein
MAKLLLILHVLYAAKANKESREFLNIIYLKISHQNQKGKFKGFSETRLIFRTIKMQLFHIKENRRIKNKVIFLP